MPSAHSQFPRRRILGALIVLGWSSSMAADYRQSLLGNSPFGSAVASVAPPAAAELELRGIVREDDVILVNIFDGSTHSSQWIAVNSRGANIAVLSYDDSTESAQILVDSRALTLTLKNSRIAPPPKLTVLILN